MKLTGRKHCLCLVFGNQEIFELVRPVNLIESNTSDGQGEITDSAKVWFLEFGLERFIPALAHGIAFQSL
jgi:hypothetical protein